MANPIVKYIYYSFDFGYSKLEPRFEYLILIVCFLYFLHFTVNCYKIEFSTLHIKFKAKNERWKEESKFIICLCNPNDDANE